MKISPQRHRDHEGSENRIDIALKGDSGPAADLGTQLVSLFAFIRACPP